MVPIHEKIVHLLETRRLKRRDLARGLGVSPQTATDICKGRSAITLPHLRSLVTMFGLRADYWLDDARLEPSVSDHTDVATSHRIASVLKLPILRHEDPGGLIERMTVFAREHQTEFRRRYPDLGPEELGLLGIHDGGQGIVGRV